ncbi:NAD(+) diphosphatase [Methanosarcina sp. MSH10X1]|uniref:NAD(+) diphosphatase n=1 Tax=Methanosarcina sp. MSH10X1 TaxID=2507075 RepID=UPI000FFC202F|nr:NAD(+) diphosphatase [Methanosarcina sp. MSH10X1]RXA19917.1 NAD(+) diphosphatase [Methanosarcina sp. MSH10X1]
MTPVERVNPICPEFCPEFIVGIEPPADRTEKALWFIFRGREILLRLNKNPGAIPRLLNFEELGLPGIREQYLGTLDGTHCYSVELPEDSQAPEGTKFADLRQAYSEMNEKCFALVNKAVQVMEWDRTNQFCSRCGTKTLQKPGERGKECPDCGELFYPRISPAVIVLIRKEHEILLARSPSFPQCLYGLIAGFVEPGESAEAAVVREIREEVGIEVKNINYFGTQAWPFPNSLMIGFTAEYSSGDIQPDGLEIDDAKWFPAGDLPVLPGKISIARKLIDHFLKEEGMEV